MFVPATVSESADGGSIFSDSGYIVLRVYGHDLDILDSSCGMQSKEGGTEKQNDPKSNHNIQVCEEGFNAGTQNDDLHQNADDYYCATKIRNLWQSETV